ncbi:hypothetical protein HYALB_00000575 [Hymenoscyphus albidus]|uniref:CID domain-containing protein n=1 Tax=Hymenoscyphus albidus TaxID=595503 RepID=A0A9N9M3D6_9HELO|nr:hypothetical protein HYALB_00000575 [Hymenoscyphus albidus]
MSHQTSPQKLHLSSLIPLPYGSSASSPSLQNNDDRNPATLTSTNTSDKNHKTNLRSRERRGKARERGRESNMDPFEVRIRFTQHLQHLNASVTSANKAAQYALKFRDMDEDLHNCILEQLERNSMNNRANIMYFIEHLCDMAAREKHHDYVRMMQRDILRIVDAVAPEDGSGAANVKVVRKVLQALTQKTYLLPQTLLEIEECLISRDTHSHPSSPTSPVDVEMSGVPYRPSISKPPKLDKKQVEQRIEEDRERHKRLRENIWAISNPEGGDREFNKMWEETSDVGEDDFLLYEEEAVERGVCAGEWREEFLKMHGGLGEV